MAQHQASMQRAGRSEIEGHHLAGGAEDGAHHRCRARDSTLPQNEMGPITTTRVMRGQCLRQLELRVSRKSEGEGWAMRRPWTRR